MARSRRRSEAPKLRVIPGGKAGDARVVVRRDSKLPVEPATPPRSVTPSEAAERPSEPVEAPVDSPAPRVGTTPAVPARRRLFALAVALVAATLAYLLLRRR